MNLSSMSLIRHFMCVCLHSFFWKEPIALHHIFKGICASALHLPKLRTVEKIITVDYNSRSCDLNYKQRVYTKP